MLDIIAQGPARRGIMSAVDGLATDVIRSCIAEIGGGKRTAQRHCARRAHCREHLDNFTTQDVCLAEVKRSGEMRDGDKEWVADVE